MSTKIIFSEMIWVPNFHRDITSIVILFITSLRMYNFVDMVQTIQYDCIDPIVSFRLYRSDCIVVDTICLFGGFHKKKRQFNYSSLFWCRLFTHFVIRVWFCCLQVNCAKFSRLLAPPATPGSRQCCQKKNLM